MGAPKKKSDKFRFCARKVGLTYSCPKDADDNPIQSNEDLLDFLEKLGGHCQYIIAKERHQSGKKHFHAWINWDEKQETKNVEFFDYLGVHPNVLFKPGAGWQAYCRKDKDFITNLEQNPFAVALAKNTVEEAVDHLWVARPQLMAVNADRVQKNFAKKMAAPKEIKRFNGPWKWPYLEDIQSVVLVGPSNVGITQFAKHHFQNPIIVRHMDKLKEFNASVHDGIIFDDMSFTHLHREAQIHITDWDEDSDLHIRYGTATIPAGTKKIFTANYYPFSEDDAIDRRIKLVNI